ncbi:unnamed protein product [Onchocerca flexuosa]|uniref:MIF4G domain-containing protein n=1 Tax=Onchocerca flexuosa TaxID=387005 RepID=A0A183I7C8_9BILA|nr:unnamed protein product [Onchocerca flexuosa]
MKEIRKEELMRGIDEDDMEIHRYERILGYNKRKSKNMPKVFRAEGLDYLLEMCDSKPLQHSDMDVDNGTDVDDDSGTDVDDDSGTDVDSTETLNDEENKSTSKNTNKNITSATCIPKANLPTSSKIQESNSVENSEDEKDTDMNLQEDIYGRLVNKNTGEFFPSKLYAKEKLNELEQKAGLLETEEHLKLKKSLRGLVNRLNEHTLVGAVKTFSDIFASRGHNEVKQLFFSEVVNSMDVGYRLPDRLITEYAVFIALIHTTVSAEISAYFIENYVVKLLEIVTTLPEGKSLENFCILLAELYNFKVIKVIIITEIMRYLREKVDDKCLTCFKAFLTCKSTHISKNN